MKTSPGFRVFPCNCIWYLTALRAVSRIHYADRVWTHKLMEPRWIGMNGAFATRSPSGANSAHEKSSRSFMFVLIAVCCKERPMASATLMKRFAKRVRRIGSGGLYLGCSTILSDRD